MHAEKYGMLASEAHHIVRRYFEVLDEQAALAGAEVAYDIKRSQALRAVRERVRQRSQPAPAVPAQATPATVSAQPHDLRARLGLS